LTVGGLSAVAKIEPSFSISVYAAFSPAAIALTAAFTLEPGDIISTGTPSGVGFSYNPPRWLKPGDNVTVKIEGVGELTNPFVSE
jgi:2-keto-4-pentenoate hydratase/2-oxohepta-3-ene-1,7-dioic acid hydratase in catechol pathway